MSNVQLELIAHPLCPYARRALYSLAFKGVPATITHVDVSKQEPWFLEINPLGEVPALKITSEGKLFKLSESLNVSEYFDSFPGPALYPRNPDGSLNALEKGLLDVFIKLQLSDLGSQFYNYFIKEEPDAGKGFKEVLVQLNGYAENGNFLAHKLLGRNELTIADVIAFPFIETFFGLKQKAEDIWTEVNPEGLTAWYAKLSEFPWIQAHKVPEHRFHKLLHLIKTGQYSGLALPLFIYDE